MVHLAAVPTKADLASTTVNGVSLEKLKLDMTPEDDNAYTTTVYGSKYADLPKYEMPEHEMPKEVAYRMIKYVIHHL
jgi:glutamate decarboxylase